MTPFGTTKAGQDVHAIRLSAGDLTVTLLTYGAIVQSVRLAGVAHDLTVGADRMPLYQGPMQYNGALIGPVANRIAGARASIGGQIHRFEANQNGQHTLHSGSAGFHTRIWAVEDHGPTHATLTLDAPDGLGGFPGNRRITARFEVQAPATLQLTVTATTDAATLMNPANHSYWTLDGGATWAGHSLQVAADHILPCDSDTIPTGNIRSVAGTPYDLRQPRLLTPGAPALDHNFCLTGGQGALREVATLTGRSGLSMIVATTAPGLQIYDGRAPTHPDHPAYHALALETQGWPDAANQPHFPRIDLAAGQRYRQQTEWRFDRRDIRGNSD